MTTPKRIAEEETWTEVFVTVTSDGSGAAVYGSGGGIGTSDYDRTHGTFLDEARAQVAACAPEALRMLLKWGCQSAGCQAQHMGGCREDCEWLALMRKAGVRE